MITTTRRTLPKSMSNDKKFSKLQTPCYVLDVKQVNDNIDSLISSFRKHYSNFELAYSFKTNMSLPLCNLIKSKGCYAEVVSPVELQLAKKLGFGKKIIYNGVIKDYKSKFKLTQPPFNGIVNVDSIHELSVLAEMASKRKVFIEVGVRMNFDIGTGKSSHFGVEYTSENISILERYNRTKYVSISGIHCHLSNGRGLPFWMTRVRKMAYLGKILNVDYIDLGGNMYGKMHPDMKEQFEERQNEIIPTFEDYAIVVGGYMNKYFESSKRKPTLIIETGTPVISNAMSVIGKVTDVKKIDNVPIATLDCSTYTTGFLSYTIKMPITVKHLNPVNNKNYHDNWMLCGYTCTEGDFLSRSFDGNLDVGDLVEIENVGAYSYAVAPLNFIMPPAAMYAKYPDGTYKLLKRRGNLKDILRPFVRSKI